MAKFIFITPAATVIGSPMIGTHANRTDQLPHLLNHVCALER